MSSPNTNPALIESLTEEFKLVDKNSTGTLDSSQLKTLLTRRMARTKIRKMKNEKALEYTKVKATDMMEKETTVDALDVKLVGDIVALAFKEHPQWGRKCTLQNFISWQVEISQKKQLIGKETFDNMKGSFMSMLCCASGKTAGGEDVAISPITEDARRAELERPPSVYDVTKGPGLESRVNSSEIIAGALSNPETDEDAGLSKLERHTKSIRKINKIEKTTNASMSAGSFDIGPK